MYERNYNLLRAKFSEFFLPTIFTSMAGNICLFVDGLIVSFLIGASNLAPIQIVAPVITFVNLIYWMIGLGGSVLCSVAKAEFDEEGSNSYFSVSIISFKLNKLIVEEYKTVLKSILFPDKLSIKICG